jgi:hypothetical protein
MAHHHLSAASEDNVVHKESEIAKAWAEHDPSRASVPQHLMRQLREYKRHITVTAAILERMLKNDAMTEVLVKSAVLRRGVSRQRELKRLRRLLPDAVVRIAPNNTLEIAWLMPRRHLIVDPVGGEAQDCILANFVLAWPRTRRDVTMWSGWSAEFPDHACGRFLQRSGSDDLKAALLAAGQAFMAAHAVVLDQHVNAETSVYLPAGRGCFASQTIGATAGSRRYIYARARTWIAFDMLGKDQCLLAPAAEAEQTVAMRLFQQRDDIAA